MRPIKRAMLKPVAVCTMILGLLAAGASWLLYEPYDPPRLYQPVPAYASYVSLHDDIAHRWKEWTRNPIAQSLLASSGLRPQELENARNDSQLQILLSTLAGKRTLLAYIPSLGESGLPGWVFTSYLGGRSVWLRWMLNLYPQENLVHVGNSRGVDLWMVDDGGAGAERLYFSITRGMVVGCYAGDPSGQTRLLDLLDYGNPHWQGLSTKLEPDQLCDTSASPDRGWMELLIPGQEQGLHFALTQVDAKTLKGRVCGSLPVPLAEPVDNDAVLETLKRFVLPDSLAWSVGTVEALPLLFSELAPVDAVTVGLPLGTPAFLSLQGGAFSGRLFGMKVPSALLAIPVADEAEAERAVNRVLDVVNRELLLGLVPKVSVQKGFALTLVDASIRSKYSVLSDKDKVAYLYWKGWLLVSSHARALPEVAGWLDAGAPLQNFLFDPDNDDAQAHVWMNVESVRATVPPILQILKFKLLLDQGEGSKIMRERLADAEGWLEAFATFDQGRISLYSTPGETIMDLHFGGLSQ